VLLVIFGIDHKHVKPLPVVISSHGICKALVVYKVPASEPKCPLTFALKIKSIVYRWPGEAKMKDDFTPESNIYTERKAKLVYPSAGCPSRPTPFVYLPTFSESNV